MLTLVNELRWLGLSLKLLLLLLMCEFTAYGWVLTRGPNVVCVCVFALALEAYFVRVSLRDSHYRSVLKAMVQENYGSEHYSPVSC